MYEIKTLNKIAACGTDIFDKAKYSVSDNAENPTAIMVRSAKMHDMEMPSELLAIARAGAGVNNIPVDKCAEQGIVVFNTPGANANAVKEIALCGLLMASRKIPEAMQWAQSLKGSGAEVGKLVEKGKSNFAGCEIMGKTLGLIGLGAIGGKLANIAISLGMNVIGYDPFLSVGAALSLKPQVKVTANINDIYACADYISLHLPYNAETKDTINKETIALCKDGVKLLNFARGELVNSADIIEAVGSGKVSRYVVDFPCDEILGVENIVAIPHLGASTEESEDNCAVMAANELIDYIERGAIRNSVNFPNAELAKTGDALVCVLHKNTPAIISQVTAAVSDKGANIENLVNKSKKDWAYTMLDVNGEVDVEAINAVEGVVKVRVL
ncbi:3-phosphoglycerate dehydrogenase family protein [Ruminococcus sp. Marseille-P6503]|uniref:3-phosphoglycerate dehydrogenase family protein n=1 Tax=Ruminococcus sp. Marseille-P6503 TaxID=2364796 RepID=UPI000F520E0F|nr:3-phosphoglycerate dehydrogenase family protein [Ruminococcus sp. Marseille-P6503]